ncbi:MAG: PHB depolymerase family esterase [Acidobacteriaceae bacterium]
MNRGPLLLSCFFLSLFAVLPACAKSKDKVEHETFTFNGAPREYLVQIPSAASPTAQLPVVVLIHDQGGWATDVMGAWQGLASSRGFIAIAPESLHNTMWDSTVDGPAYLHAVVDEVAKKHPIDRSRVYLFGVLSGGVYATAVGIYDSEYWAATAVHAAIMDPSNYSLFSHAVRKEPFEDWVGDQDADHDLRLMGNEHDAFVKAGFPFELKIIPNSSGSYGNVEDEVNEGSWKFFTKYHIGNGSPASAAAAPK